MTTPRASHRANGMIDAAPDTASTASLTVSKTASSPMTSSRGQVPRDSPLARMLGNRHVRAIKSPQTRYGIAR
jgi:hypothetical protein